jgi:tRNA-specific 2-thiouridylase
MNNNKKKVIIAISGGVDSSAAAFILKKQGYDLIGIYFRTGVQDKIGEEAARKVCRFLNIPFFPINLSYQFKKEVIDYFILEYSRGLTPNPCVRCNKLIKFGELFKIAKDLGANFMATGHYIKKEKNKNNFTLFKGEDTLKDQTYFLYNLNQEILEYILFPLGNYTKEEIKKIAKKEKLPFLESESQDICFLNEDGKIINHNDFLRKNIKLKPGPIKTMDNKEIGRHQGLALYTIGQRKGIEIGGTGPFYALKKDYESNTLYVVDNLNNPALFAQDFIINDVNWISGLEPKLPFNCEVVIRYRHKPLRCTIDFFKGSFDLSQTGKKYIINLQKPERAISPGQSAVFYKGDELIGGGVIL